MDMTKKFNMKYTFSNGETKTISVDAIDREQAEVRAFLQLTSYEQMTAETVDYCMTH